MKRTCVTILSFVLVLLLAAMPANAQGKNKADGIKIKDGILVYSAGHYLAGQPLMLGFDPYGYNYNARMFKGSYANAYLGGYGYPPYNGDDAAYLAENPNAANTWMWPYRKTQLTMKWNDAWLSNMDRDYDGKLDRHFGYPSYLGSGAWITNHMWGDVEVNGKDREWNYFVKIVAAPADAYKSGGIYYTADGVEIGSVIWGQFAIIMQVENDPSTGTHGAQYISPNGAGFGKYGPQGN